MGFFNHEFLESEGTFVSRICIQLVLILFLPRILHKAFLSHLLQPRVISEIVSGIILGPSCLGQIEGFTDLFFPSRSIPYLQALGAIGVILFMFMTGLHLVPEQLWKVKFKSFAASVCAIGCTFAIAPALVPHLQSPLYTSFNYSQLLILAAILLSIPAEAVMARILAERGLLGTPMGSWCMAADTVGLLICFLLLATLLSLYGSENPWEPPTNLCPGQVAVSPNDAESTLDPLWIFLIFIGLVILLFTVFRVIFHWMASRTAKKGRMEATVFVFAMILLFSVAWFTQTLTLSSLIGPILMGFISVPRFGTLTHDLEAVLGPITVGICLPIFFALVGLKTDFTLLGNTEIGLAFMLLGALWGTTFVAAFIVSTVFGGFAFKNFYFATLLTCKGLTALTIFNILFSVGVITNLFYATVVLYALISCALVSPIIWLAQQLQNHLKEQRRRRAALNRGGRQQALHIMVMPEAGYLAPVSATLAAWIANCTGNDETEVLFLRFIDDFDQVEQYVPLLAKNISAAILSTDPILGPCQVRWNGLRPVGSPHFRALLAPSLEDSFRRIATQGLKRKDSHKQPQPFGCHIIGFDRTPDSEALLLAALKLSEARVFAVTGQPAITLAGSHSALIVVSGEGSNCQYLNNLFEAQGTEIRLLYWRPLDAVDRPKEVEHCGSVLEIFRTLSAFNALETKSLSFDVVFCPMPASTTALFEQLEAASHCPIPVIFESDPALSDATTVFGSAPPPSDVLDVPPRLDIDDDSQDL